MAFGFAAADAVGIATAEDLLAAGDLGPCELVGGTGSFVSTAVPGLSVTLADLFASTS